MGFAHLQSVFLVLVFYWSTCVLADPPGNPTVVVVCLNGQFTASCPAGKVLAIHRANFGRVTGNTQCLPDPAVVPTSCSPDNVVDAFAKACSLKTSCAVTVADPAVSSNYCENSSPYLSVEYFCVPSNRIKSICDFGSESFTGEGYAKSPGYPNDYPLQRVCQVHARSTTADHGGLIKAQIQLIDLALCLGENCFPCQDYLLHNRLKVCLMLPPGATLVTTQRPELSATFFSDHIHQYRGFLLYYNISDIPGPGTSTPANDDVRDGNGNKASSNLVPGKCAIMAIASICFFMLNKWRH